MRTRWIPALVAVACAAVAVSGCRELGRAAVRAVAHNLAERHAAARAAEKGGTEGRGEAAGGSERENAEPSPRWPPWGGGLPDREPSRASPGHDGTPNTSPPSSSATWEAALRIPKAVPE